MKTVAPFLVFLAVAMLSGCYNNEVKRDPAFAAVRPAPIEPQDNYDGAIFDARNNISLFEDYRARRVGDILTVKLEEQTDAEKETETTVSKSNSNNIDNPTLFGTTP